MNNLPVIITGHHHNNYNLSVTAKINGQVLSSVDTQGTLNLNFEYNENLVVRHEFEIIVNGKVELLKSIHNNPTVREQLINSAYIINSVKFGEYDVTPILLKSAKYYHTQNNNVTECVAEDYTNWLGCDGIVKFTFVTPLFAWFLSDFEY